MDSIGGYRDLLQAIADGRVTRDDSTRRGMWALYVLDGQEVGMAVRHLARLQLIEKPLLGPPRINADGRAALAG